ncbi:hypothetical protein [Pelagicoccus sp. SDUM812003]|uniref:hypothetical protein n=1 Tax=Pelagicoccus sp. SDUM812003 TaxID=3041267 RepID=UPI0028107042|nr:hypothetical protein [Pelagicoccus sp. SDUM812003]MDQ8203357.1 hypothetical protein [Pelagicoccus sp. SDUM812003]
MNKKKAVFFTGVCAGVLVSAFYLISNRAGDQSVFSDELKADGAEASETDKEEAVDLEALFAEGATQTDVQTIDLSKERPAVLETRRMYQAHASLRSPEVSAPDSATNTRTRAIMLDKMALLAARLDERKRAEQAKQP